eukprot:GHVN01063622.1.p2 GENE.GHVN01063622.1~~GHVN01063622.1.p2  ORF type:complete len:271 (+),score=28.69 GHVN01063622.1:1802-2614(+)
MKKRLSFQSMADWAIEGGVWRAEIAVCSEQNSRFRNEMEDRFCVFLDGNEFLCGIFDGHSGEDVAEHCQAALHAVFKNELVNGGTPGACLSRAFAKLDATVIEAGLQGGAAVSVVYARRAETPVLHCANVGDVEAFLFDQKSITALTRRHVASDKSERQRIRNSNGFVLGGRVFGVINITRALGDSLLKECIIAEPFLSEAAVDGESDAMIVMASDGLWDVCTEEKAREIVDQKTPFPAAKALVEYALENESTDNITVAIIRLSPGPNTV